MEPTAELLSLAEELRSYIMSFLPWQDILRCSSVSYNLLMDFDTDFRLAGM